MKISSSYMHTHIYTDVHIHVPTHTRTHTCTPIQMYTHTHAHEYRYTHARRPVQCTHTHTTHTHTPRARALAGAHPQSLPLRPRSPVRTEQARSPVCGIGAASFPGCCEGTRRTSRVAIPLQTGPGHCKALTGLTWLPRLLPFLTLPPPALGQLFRLLLPGLPSPS